MAIPEQIRKQTEAVQELYKQLNPDEDTDTGDSAADETTVATEAAQPPETEQKQGGEQVSDEAVLQKYKTLQGMYNAEVPRLHQQNREMQQRIQQMEQLLASVSTQQAQPQPQAPQTAERYVTDEDVDEYGDSLDMMRRVSREELIPVAQRLSQIESMLKQMQTNVVPQVQNLTQRQQLSAEQQFWSELATAIPNFRDINAREDFQSWLLEVDPLTGIARQTYLEDAQRNLDSRRVANFFQTWLGQTGQAAVAQNSGKRTATSELEKQVAPGRSRGAGAPASTGSGKIYSPADITAFFNDVRSGKYKGREQERDRIERDIFAAQRENRIQNTA